MKKLAFLGAGNIAQAIIGGLLENGYTAADIHATDPQPLQLASLAERGIQTSDDNRSATAGADIVVIAVKPDISRTLAESIRDLAENRLFVSVAAGITTDSLRTWLGTDNVIRCMPNTPALIRQGMTGLYATRQVSENDRHAAGEILSAIGQTLWFEEETMLDTVTAVSGSGPAYFFYFIELLEAAAEDLGLTTGQARSLVLQTALGASMMAASTPETVAELRRKVTSPGGTTQAALSVMMERGLEQTVRAAVEAARTRSVELSGSQTGTEESSPKPTT